MFTMAIESKSAARAFRGDEDDVLAEHKLTEVRRRPRREVQRPHLGASVQALAVELLDVESVDADQLKQILAQHLLPPANRPAA